MDGWGRWGRRETGGEGEGCVKLAEVARGWWKNVGNLPNIIYSIFRMLLLKE